MIDGQLLRTKNPTLYNLLLAYTSIYSTDYDALFPNKPLSELDREGLLLWSGFVMGKVYHEITELFK